MMKKVKLLLSGMVLSSVLAMSGCVVHATHPQGYGYGPPPHAPAHGYRHKYHNHDLVYDANLGVYIVLGFTDYYFLDDIYYHHRHDGWYYSRDFDRDWRQYKDKRLPPGLAKKYRDRDRDNGRDYDRDRDYDRYRYRYR
jgi:hypothetical protein